MRKNQPLDKAGFRVEDLIRIINESDQLDMKLLAEIGGRVSTNNTIDTVMAFIKPYTRANKNEAAIESYLKTFLRQLWSIDKISLIAWIMKIQWSSQKNQTR